MTTASSSSHATSSRLHKYGSYAEDDRGRIRAYDDPNLCIYIRSKTDSQTSRLAECDKTQKSDENKHNTAWDYNGSAKLYDEISVSSIYNNDEACTASNDGTEIGGTQCSDLCLTYVGNSLEPDDWVKTLYIPRLAIEQMTSYGPLVHLSNWGLSTKNYLRVLVILEQVGRGNIVHFASNCRIDGSINDCLTPDQMRKSQICGAV